MPPQNMSLWHKYYFELKITEKQQKAINALRPSPTCLKENCDYLALDTLISLEMKSTEQALLKNTLFSISFPHIYQPTVCDPWKSQTCFLCLVNSLEMYCSLLRCYISLSSNHSFELLSHICMPQVLINCLFFSY